MLENYPKLGLVATLLVFVGIALFVTDQVARHTVAESIGPERWLPLRATHIKCLVKRRRDC
jgi:hypothetical protein